MNKSILLVILALISCAYALHMQKYAPSQPGGNYLPANGTSTNNYNNGGYSGPLINGQPYVYTGPFTLACWLPTNTQRPFRYDTCYNAQGCYQMLIDYKQCQGTVKKYPPIQA